VLLSVFFAGISGSSTADAASQSKIFIEAQVKEGYGLSFSIAITAVSAVLAVIIHASILMIVWGGVISTSIGAMYLAGILPGLLIAAAQMADRARLLEDLQLPGLSARHTEGVLRLGLAVAAGAFHPVHHRRRHPARLVHRHRIGLHRGALCRRALLAFLPRDGLEAALPLAARNRAAVVDRAVLRRARRPPSAGCSPTTRFRKRCSRT
jgi:hypothetical protein